MRIIGTPEDDLIQSPMGRSTVRALAGDDTVYGAFDALGDHRSSGPFDPDLVFLGAGNDVALAFKHSDTVYGGRGDDIIEMGGINAWGYFSAVNCKAYGEAGDDYLSGGGLLNGGDGNDTMEGSGRMVGGAGNDVYYCQGVNADIIDRQGASTISVIDRYYDYSSPGEGEFRIVTGDGRDIITASENLRIIRSGDRGDYISGGYEVYAGDGNDTVEGGRSVWGGDGRDILSGGTFVYGGTGNDTITDAGRSGGFAKGGDGNDWIENSFNPMGQAGNDYVSGRGLLRGGNGNDKLEGVGGYSAFHDTLLGGRGQDTLFFAYGEGDDELHGDQGADTFALRSYLPDMPYYLVLTADIIADFEQGIDVIDLSADADLAVPGGFTGREGVAAFEDLTITQAGDDVTLRDQEGYVLVVVTDQLASDFTADDFLF